MLPKGRLAWCSNECRDKHYMALSSYVRPKVRRRDRCICALCGVDADFLRRIFWVLKRAGDLEAFALVKQAWGIRVHAWDRWAIPTHTWEADHIVPLAEGGTNDLDNYRTLCLSCHKAETKALAGRLAAARRTGGMTT